jgi:hypothetical protein
MKKILVLFISITLLSCYNDCEDITLDLCDCGNNEVKKDSVLIVKGIILVKCIQQEKKNTHIKLTLKRRKNQIHLVKEC